MANFLERLLGAALLNTDTYSEIERDDDSLGQSMAIVVISSLAGAMSTLRDHGLGAFLGTAVLALVAWFAWAASCHYVGTTLLAEPTTNADLSHVLRTTGFSAAPGLLRLLIIFPLVGPVFYLLGSLWMVASMIVALKVSLDYSNYVRPILVCVVGAIVYVLLLCGLGAVLFGVLR